MHSWLITLGFAHLDLCTLICNLCIGTNPSEYKFFFQQLLVYVVVLHNAHTNVRISERERWKQKKNVLYDNE